MLKTFFKSLFASALPFLLTATGIIALLNISAFGLATHFDRYPIGRSKAGQLKTGNIVKALVLTIIVALITWAVFEGLLQPSSSSISAYLFTYALIIGAAHQALQTSYNMYKFQFKSGNSEDKVKLGGRALTHLFLLSSLGPLAAGAYCVNFLGMPLMGILAIYGSLNGVLFSASGIWIDFFAPAKRFAYKCLGLSAALEENESDKIEDSTYLCTQHIAAQNIETTVDHSRTPLLSEPAKSLPESTNYSRLDNVNRLFVSASTPSPLAKMASTQVRCALSDPN